jgi:phospho-N-acetylmuramoyl-pentapeptide-transferase
VYVYKFGQASYVMGASQGLYNPAHSFFFPFTDAAIYLPPLAYVLVMVIVMTGSSNAVNITDGMDGLATGCLLIVTAVFLLISWIVGVVKWAEIFQLPFVPFSAEMTVLCAAMIGAMLGFIWYNAAPAAVYMGDTGSLSLGGLIGYIAVITRQELLLLLVGGVFVFEVLSVVIQVGVFKATKGKVGLGPKEGKRVFRCAPIHHHFHLGGIPNTKVVARFWIAGVILAALALATLKLR